MKRKNFTTFSGLLAALALIVPPAFADDAHHPEKAAPLGASTSLPAPGAATEMPADQAEAQVKKAQALMQRIEQTRDPAERQRLMHEHLQAMRDGMGMMGGVDTGKELARGKGAGMMGCDMMTGHAMMEKRMNMMQQMMEQMLRRDAVGREPVPRP